MHMTRDISYLALVAGVLAFPSLLSSGCHLALGLPDIEVQSSGGSGQGGDAQGGGNPMGGAGGDDGKSDLGESCNGSGDCSSGFCADDVCCNSTCDGECTSCNAIGSEGSCTGYPLNSDPENECGAYTCGASGCNTACSSNAECSEGKFCNGTACDFVTELSTGGKTNCVLLNSGSARCWGDNGNGQLGTGSATANSATPLPVGNVGTSLMHIAVGRFHACALYQDKNATCWGYNTHGQLGDGTLVDKSLPVLTVAPPPGGMTALALGNQHTSGLAASGAAGGWGWNQYGQLGNGGNVDATTAVAVSRSEAFVKIAAGARHSCGITSDGQVSCWGDNNLGQLGVDPNATMTSNVPIPGVIGTAFNAIELASGKDHNCAVETAGGIACWGSNNKGQLGDGSSADSFMAVSVSTTLLTPFIAVGAGSAHSCAVVADGRVFCWGDNDTMQLGTGNTMDSLSPIQVSGDGVFETVSAGELHTCGLLLNGSVRCWGDNTEGQLGDSTFTASGVPVDVIFAL